jgi:multimeric flavodoxin WrbA
MEKMQGCTACMQCVDNDDQKCVLKGDKMNEYIQKMIESDGIIIGSPTYFSDMTTSTKALIERAGYATGGYLKHKAGAAVVAVRRAGANHVFSSINYFFLIKQMFVVGSSYWNMGIGRLPGEVMNDEEGIRTFENLGKNMVFLLNKLKS